jgi:hypothetical protein
MKNLFFLLTLSLLVLSSCNKEDSKYCKFIDFKYYNNAKYFLGELSNDYLLIGVDTSYSDSQIQSFTSSIKEFDQNYNFTITKSGSYKYKSFVIKLNRSKNCSKITRLISKLEKNEMVSFAHYTMKTDDCTNYFGESMGNLCVSTFGSEFYVKVMNENDLTSLNQMIQETNTQLISQEQFMPKVFVLRATKNSKGNALAMANYFHESSLFEFSEPNIIKIPVN